MTDFKARALARQKDRKARGVNQIYPHHRTGEKPTRRPVAVCIHRGDVLTGQEREAANLDHRRQWFRCGHPEQPLGPFVCGCKGCGPTCSGYAAPDQSSSEPS